MFRSAASLLIRISLIILTIVWLSVSSLAAENERASGNTKQTLVVDGYSRTYIVHVPAHLKKHPAIVLMLHGRGGTSEQAAQEFGWVELADNAGFIAVFPQALPIVPELSSRAPVSADVPTWLSSTNDTVWWPLNFVRNLGLLHHPDDAIFLTRLIAKVVADEHADPHRVYIAGFSSGAAMVLDIAARYPANARAFAAVAAFAGLRPSKLASPVSLFLFRGDQDSTGIDARHWAFIPREQRLSWFGQESLPTFSSEMAAWVALDGCQDSSSLHVSWGERSLWKRCERNARVEGYLVHDLGHEWPGSSTSRWNQTHPSLNLSELIWKFFKNTKG